MCPPASSAPAQPLQWLQWLPLWQREPLQWQCIQYQGFQQPQQLQPCNAPVEQHTAAQTQWQQWPAVEPQVASAGDPEFSPWFGWGLPDSLAALSPPSEYSCGDSSLAMFADIMAADVVLV
jgi:hypothetical protein